MKHVFQSVVIWRNEAGLLNKSLASPSSVTYIWLSGRSLLYTLRPASKY